MVKVPVFSKQTPFDPTPSVKLVPEVLELLIVELHEGNASLLTIDRKKILEAKSKREEIDNFLNIPIGHKG